MRPDNAMLLPNPFKRPRRSQRLVISRTNAIASKYRLSEVSELAITVKKQEFHISPKDDGHRLCQPYRRAGRSIIFGKETKGEQSLDHHLTFRRFRLSALRHCRLCSLLWPQDLTTQEYKSIGNRQYNVIIRGSPKSAIVFIEYENEELSSVMVRKLTKSHYGFCLRSTETDSDEVFELARSWLNLCLHSHSICQSIRPCQDDYLKRLLSVSVRNERISICLHPT
jgi:hypothetical protein